MQVDRVAVVPMIGVVEGLLQGKEEPMMGVIKGEDRNVNAIGEHKIGVREALHVDKNGISPKSSYPPYYHVGVA